MTKSKENLGRKILDLIQENEIVFNDNEEIVEIELTKIFPNPQQPRKTFDIEKLQELSDSISLHGVIQPVIVKPEKSGYMLIAGERRVRAAKMANLKTIPCIIRQYDDQYVAEISILENLQRENLSPIEEAVAFRQIIKKLGLKHEELAKKLGKSRPYVTNALRLLRLPSKVLDLLNDKKISIGHTRLLSRFDDQEKVENIIDIILNHNLSIRETERLISDIENNKSKGEKRPENFNEKLIRFFNHDVYWYQKNNNLIVRFKTKEELDEFLDSIKEES